VLAIAILIIVIIILALNGRGAKSAAADTGLVFPSTSESQISAVKSKVNDTLTYDIVNSEPEKYRGQIVRWGGKVFVEPEKDANGVYLQAYASESDKNFVINYPNPKFDVKKDDYIIAYGVVEGRFTGKNAFGAEINVPQITAAYIEKTSRSSALAPAQNSIPVNQQNAQNGFIVSIDKVELAADETRVYLTVNNTSEEKVSFYTYDARLVAGSKQLEPISQYGSGEELPSDFRNGIKSTGVLVFPKLDKNQTVKLFLSKPYGEDYNKNWNEINFENIKI